MGGVKMNRKKIYTAAVLAIVVGVGMASRPARAGSTGFTLASLKGNYIFRASGFTADDNGDQGGINFAGLLTMNGAGGINAVDIQVTGGDDSSGDRFDCGAITSAPTSSYSVNSDGTGHITLVFPSTDSCLPQDTISFKFALSRTSGAESQISSATFSSSNLFPGNANGCIVANEVYLAEPAAGVECLTALVLDGEMSLQ
jgi:hypothetical protein